MTLAATQAPFHPTVRTADLTATTDINGGIIAVGTLVRSFDFPFEFNDGRVAGFGLNDERTCYYEGIVRAIGAVRLEGCPRYTIEVTVHRSARDGRIVENEDRAGIEIFPPLNGTPTWMDNHTCGVVAIAA